MATIQFDPAAPPLRGVTQAEDYQLNVTYTSGTEGTAVVTEVPLGDVMVTQTTPPIAIEGIEVDVTLGASAVAPSVVSTTPETCRVESDGSVTTLSTGFCLLEANSPAGMRILQEFVRRTPGTPVYSNPSQPVVGSLRRYLLDQQLAAISGVTPGSDAQRSGIGKNPWVPGGFAGVNPNNFLRSQSRPGFAPFPLDALDQIINPAVQWKAWISPHHFLTWRGHGTGSGATWVSLNGETIIEYSATRWNGTLCKLLPSDFLRWLPTVASIGWYLPVWGRLWNTYIGADNDVNAERGWIQPGNHSLSNPFPADDLRRPFQRVGSGTPAPMLNGGDSGSPVFIGINGNLVPVCHVAYQGIFGSFPYHNLRTEIDNAMAFLNGSGIYAVQTVDLSAFTTFS